MKYYIATSLKNVAAHNRVRDDLEAFGHEITYDWTEHGSMKLVSKERLREVAILELEGISKVDFVLVLLPGGGGTHLEFGFALAKGKRVFLHSEDPVLFELGPQTNGFYHHPDVTCLTGPIECVASELQSVFLDQAAGLPVGAINQNN